MNNHMHYCVLCGLLVVVSALNSDTRRRPGICPWMDDKVNDIYNIRKNSTCNGTDFLCSNGKCIVRRYYCDEANDCGDNSDERFCNNHYRFRDEDFCVNVPNHFKCGSKCLPAQFVCDGVIDCKNGKDEELCEVSSARVKALKWLYSHSQSESTTEVWGPLVDKAAVALYLGDPTFSYFNSTTKKEMAYELSIQLLSRLMRTKLEDIPSNDLASFLNAFLVTCIDPRKFHGIDIVQELRNRVDRENATNPYVLLSLCNAGEKMTESDRKKLIQNFWNSLKPVWTDVQAFSVMAFACAIKQNTNTGELYKFHQFIQLLKQQQHRNGSADTLQTTALIMQALLAAQSDDDPDNFDEQKALNQIISSQKPDGSFGNWKNTYFVLPVLSCKSLVNINSDHCQPIQRDEISALVNLANRNEPKKRVQYSIWIGNARDLERTLVLRVPQNMSFYGVMEIAAEVDNRYSFEYVMKNDGLYITALSGFQDDPEKEVFWFMYRFKNGQPSIVQASPAEMVPDDNDHYLMWYRNDPLKTNQTI